MKKLITIVAIISLPLFAQDITNKLGGDTANETYEVRNASGTLLFQIQGDGGALFVNNAMSGTIPMQGIGDRMMWYPAKGAFRAGYVSGTQWDDTNIGNYSIATGSGTRASGDYSTAMGSNSTASGLFSVALGGATASGDASVALGGGAASGFGSTAMGVNTVASGYQSTAMGYNTIANTANGVAIGLYNTSSTNHLLSVGNGVSNASRSDAFVVTVNGDVGIGTSTPSAKLSIVGLSEYADNTAALAAGLVTGDLYRTGDLLKIVH